MTARDGGGRASDHATPADAPRSAPPQLPDPHTPEGRDAIAELFLREYHRLGGAAARAAASDTWSAQVLRRRAIAWRTTAGRIRAVAASRWPGWVIAHLTACEEIPVIGAEYSRQRIYLERVVPRDTTGAAGVQCKRQ